MAFSDLDRKGLIVPFTVVAQDFLAARSETVAEAAVSFICPWAGVIKGMQASLTVLTGTTKTWTVSLANAVPTTLLTLTDLTDVVLRSRTTDLSIKVGAGQVLTVNHAFGNTDCVAEGCLVVVEFQIQADL